MLSGSYRSSESLDSSLNQKTSLAPRQAFGWKAVIMAGSARPTFNFSEHNSRGGCSTENGKRKTENFSGQPLKPCGGASDQALAEQAVQVLGHHLALHVVIDEPGFFHFAIDQAAGHQPGQGLGGS